MVGLGGCSSVRLAYGQAPSASYWWLDGYLDFTEPQTLQVRSHLTAFFDWHRATQLPDHVDLLMQARGEVLQNTTPAQVCGWVETVRTRLDTSLERLLLPMTEVGRTLSPAQLQHLSRKFTKNNGEFTEEFLQPDRARRHKASVKRAVDRAELLYGDLTRPQRDMLSEGVKNSPFNPELWLSERTSRQQDILQTLRSLPALDAVQANAALDGLAKRFLHSPRPAFQAYERQLLDYNCALAAQLHNGTSLVQRQEAVARLKGWEDDLRALAPAVLQ